MSTSGVVVALRVNATPTRAFDAFTREIGTWWQPNELFPFTPDGAGVMSFEGELGGRLVERFPNGERFEVGRITAWEPGARVAFTWRQASFGTKHTTHVEVRFEAAGEQTRVTVEHHGWETIPQEHAARHTFPDTIFLRRHAEWWQALLASFAGCLQGR